MEIVVSHTNLDFDGLASMIGANKLYPQSIMVLPERISPRVRHFLAIYKDEFPFQQANSINFSKVTHVIMVDTNSLSRIDISQLNSDGRKITVFDHHPKTNNTIEYLDGEISTVGATITIIGEHLQKASIAISPFEATVFALGLYSDTGSFTYDQTTARDLKIGAWFLDNGAKLSVVQQFREVLLSQKEEVLFQHLLDNANHRLINGLEIIISYVEQDSYTGNLSLITKKLLDRSGANAVFSIAKMGEKVFVVARASSDRINVLPVIHQLKGGGHKKAASAMVKGEELTSIIAKVESSLRDIVMPSITVNHIMSSPVRVVAPGTSIEDVSKMLYRYGHTGFPVVEEDHVVGIISRRDVDKAIHHGLGHAPVKGFMSRQPVTIGKNESLVKVQQKMIEKQVGRLPVLEKDELVGIVSRTDVIEALHGSDGKSLSAIRAVRDSNASKQRMNLQPELKEQLDTNVYTLLQQIGALSSSLGIESFLIGGMVRDLILKRKNLDIDIVVEGDGIEFAQHLQEKHGGTVRSHEEFGTATWKYSNKIKIDLISARTEYYDFPAALPKVEMSTIKEDLYRRDFTINAMAICLHRERFGQLIDYFNGYQDLQDKKIKILYNLSFVEDPTRILRAIRFESRFHFSMDSETELFARQGVNNLTSLSKPRISNELKRLFNEEDPVYGVDRLIGLGALSFLIKKTEKEDILRKRVELLKKSVNHLREHSVTIRDSIYIGYLLLLTAMDIGVNSELYEYTLTKQEHKLLDDVASLIDTYSRNFNSPPSIGEWHRSFSSFSSEALLTYLSFTTEETYKAGLHYLLSREKMEKKLTGEDLINHGLKPGPAFKELLLYAEEIQLDNPMLEKEKIIQQLMSDNR